MKEYSIKEVSDMFQLTPATLRYYEDMGILTNVPRTASGRRIYKEMHINRLRTICCFKNTGMTITQLQEFFTYEEDQNNHIDDILILLQRQQDTVEAQMKELQKTYAHVLRKQHYFQDIKTSLENGEPHPDWSDYKYKDFTDQSPKP